MRARPAAGVRPACAGCSTWAGQHAPAPPAPLPAGRSNQHGPAATARPTTAPNLNNNYSPSKDLAWSLTAADSGAQLLLSASPLNRACDRWRAANGGVLERWSSVENVAADVALCRNIARFPLYVRVPEARAARHGLPQPSLDVGGQDYPIAQTNVTTLLQLWQQCWHAAGRVPPVLTLAQQVALPHDGGAGAVPGRRLR